MEGVGVASGVWWDWRGKQGLQERVNGISGTGGPVEGLGGWGFSLPFPLGPGTILDPLSSQSHLTHSPP